MSLLTFELQDVILSSVKLYMDGDTQCNIMHLFSRQEKQTIAEMVKSLLIPNPRTILCNAPFIESRCEVISVRLPGIHQGNLTTELCTIKKFVPLNTSIEVKGAFTVVVEVPVRALPSTLPLYFTIVQVKPQEDILTYRGNSSVIKRLNIESYGISEERFTEFINGL